ncbi:MAG: hypothetical protein RSB70_02110 [Clostridium sp.]
MAYMRGKCGWVKLVSMKVHIVLKALSSLQAQTDDLRIIIMITAMEQGKPRIWRVYYL